MYEDKFPIIKWEVKKLEYELMIKKVKKLAIENAIKTPLSIPNYKENKKNEKCSYFANIGFLEKAEYVKYNKQFQSYEIIKTDWLMNGIIIPNELIPKQKPNKQNLLENVYSTKKVKRERTPNTSLRKYLFRYLPNNLNKRLKSMYGDKYIGIYAWQAVFIKDEQWLDCWVEVFND